MDAKLSAMLPLPLPLGFRAHVANVGIKDLTDDFVVVASDEPCNAVAMFTKSRFAGPSVVVSRRNAADRSLQAVVVVSKNANVATGAEGLANAEELAASVARSVGIGAEDVLVTSTGVIGRQYPMERIREHLAPYGEASKPSPGALLPLTSTDAFDVATGMMTTDTHPKVASATVGDARIVGVAKGVGMIEPDMATMLAFVFTDAHVESDDLDRMFRSVVDRTFNSLSVDTDTSTSDTAAVLANGMSGAVDLIEFEAALQSVCLDLTRQLASDGEGATKLLIVEVTSARDDAQAKRVAKAVLNSPLVKTAVHGADPNWGRVAMAIGKCSDDTDIDEALVTIRFGDEEVYPSQIGESELAELEGYLSGDEVLISIDLGIATGRSTVYGCDLSDGYVRINADYTT
ncbi:MAG TPA: bifunctional glutamate N-acetyltransferase/amino-acid acetyltransferase ArgJ [Microthrixaceae bacterium]|nr:bifunctional glutamate N-acetyltransferase/amino-acid acetyltransferase ArgJ [Microthrixaceae bacterium]